MTIVAEVEMELGPKGVEAFFISYDFQPEQITVSYILCKLFLKYA